MSLPYVLHPDAQAEFDEAYDWFEQLRAGSGTTFIDAIGKTFTSIAAQPRMHTRVYQDVRHAPVSGYPYYRVMYQEVGGVVLIVAVFHTSRDPALWQGRV